MSIELMPRLAASSRFMLTRVSLLYMNAQIIVTHTSVAARIRISEEVTLKISPIRYEEYFENPPPTERMTRPKAMAADEKTLITVSAEAVPAERTFVMIRAKSIPRYP